MNLLVLVLISGIIRVGALRVVTGKQGKLELDLIDFEHSTVCDIPAASISLAGCQRLRPSPQGHDLLAEGDGREVTIVPRVNHVMYARDNGAFRFII
jgi:hypothetical protein